MSGLSPLLVRDLGSTLDYDGLVMGHNESTKKVTLYRVTVTEGSPLPLVARPFLGPLGLFSAKHKQTWATPGRSGTPVVRQWWRWAFALPPFML